MNAKTLFLIDGFGALLSAFLLGVILVRFEPLFGMPRETLYLLASFPCIFAVYDFICYFSLSKNRSPFLQAIALANLLYCGLSAGLVIHHFSKLSSLGLAYFLLEFLIVLILVYIELKTAAREKVYKK